MGDLSKNFSRSEFACHCGCGFDSPEPLLVESLQTIRDHFGPVRIRSGCRCLKYNRTLTDSKGRRLSKDTSQHVFGKAADIWVERYLPDESRDYDRTDLRDSIERAMRSTCETVLPIEVARYAASILVKPKWVTKNKISFWDYDDLLKYGGIGVYKTFVHLDVREARPARWGLKWRGIDHVK